MAKFIELIDLSNKKLSINIDHITTIRQEDHVEIFTVDGHWANVQEKYEHVIRLIRLAHA